MRATTVLRRVLAISAVRVVAVELSGELLVVDVRLRGRRLRCPDCRFSTRSLYDRRPTRAWRHLDLAGRRCVLRMPLRRLRCPSHGVVTEAVPFAPARSGYTYAFEDLVAWLAQRADKTAITLLVRISWRSVGRILDRWIARHRSGDRLDGLRTIDVDEKSWRRGHRYVTVVADPGPPARVVWMREGRDEATLHHFFDELGPGAHAAACGDQHRHGRVVPSKPSRPGHPRRRRASIPSTSWPSPAARSMRSVVRSGTARAAQVSTRER